MSENSFSFFSVILDIGSLFTNIGLLFIGGIGIFVAWRQLKYLGEQIYESRLASSMSGALTLYSRYEEMRPLREAIKTAFSETWDQHSDQEKIECICTRPVCIDGENRELIHACIDIANFYETIGALVSTKVLPFEIAYAFFGGSTLSWWRRLNVWVLYFREQKHDSLAFASFESISNRFYKERMNRIHNLI